MTIGFAGAAWLPPDLPTVLVAADSRISSPTGTLTDAGIKTYELGGRTAMVAAGHALPALTAAEIVRSIVDNHNRREPNRLLGFYDTTRLLAFFLKQASEQQKAACDVAIAGFLSGGAAALAKVTVSPHRNRVVFFSVDAGGTLALPVGNPDAGRLLLQGIARAKQEKRPALTSGLGLVWYMSRHPGAFMTVGGGLSLGYCESSYERFTWPVVEIEGQRFLRGHDITPYYRPTWPPPIVLPYNEAWCANLDQSVETGATLEPSVEVGVGYDIDQLSTAETLFQTHDDPLGFDLGRPR